MNISHIDHLVLTVTDIEATVSFYQRILGMEKQTFAHNRVALIFGNQKINLHQAGNGFEPKANAPSPGSADLCFVIQSPLSVAIQHVRDCGIEILEGPVARTGATGPMMSFYFRDPDLNLIELCHY
ncbi:MAG TPA: VOC family protein [Gammaproteobacteria bacterium]|nr:VOC family protein [Gammaproteobacteria bacterium]